MIEKILFVIDDKLYELSIQGNRRSCDFGMHLESCRHCGYETICYQAATRMESPNRRCLKEVKV